MSKLKVGRHTSYLSSWGFDHFAPPLSFVAICIVFTHRADVFRCSLGALVLITLRFHECCCLLSSIISARVSCTCEYESAEVVTPRWMKRYRSMCFFRYRPRYRSTFETRSTWEKMAREWIHQFLPWKLYWRVPWVTETTPLTSCDVKPLLSTYRAV